MKRIHFSNYSVLLGINIISAVLFFVVLTSTNPNEVGFIGTMLPLLLIWLFLFSTVRLAAYLFNKKDSRLLKTGSLVVPSAVVLALMFSALGEVSLLETILILVLAVLTNFYLTRTWPK